MKHLVCAVVKSNRSSSDNTELIFKKLTYTYILHLGTIQNNISSSSFIFKLKDKLYYRVMNTVF